jgi:hypothetical protein
MNIPKGLDPATARWCAEVCEAMAARMVSVTGPKLWTAYQGADLCARVIRHTMEALELERAMSASRTTPRLALCAEVTR